MGVGECLADAVNPPLSPAVERGFVCENLGQHNESFGKGMARNAPTARSTQRDVRVYGHRGQKSRTPRLKRLLNPYGELDPARPRIGELRGRLGPIDDPG